MKLKKGLILSEMGDEYLVTATDKEVFPGIVRLNHTGAFLFGLLQDGASEKEIIQKMINCYSIDEKTAQCDFDDFIRMIKDASLTENEDPYRVMLNTHKEIEISPKGISMRPFLKEGRDKVTLVPFDYHAQKYDIVLYKLNDDYVLHRIIGISGTEYKICGDNSVVVETVNKNEILGKVSKVTRNNKTTVSVQSMSSKVYLFLWYRLKMKSVIYRIKRLFSK